MTLYEYMKPEQFAEAIVGGAKRAAYPIEPVTVRDRSGRTYTRYWCSYGGHQHVSHRQAQACNVRLRAKLAKKG